MVAMPLAAACTILSPERINFRVAVCAPAVEPAEGVLLASVPL